MQTVAQRARVMIAVKATPMPSAKYGDTVCVAGIRIDGGRREWVRLYPVAFRWLEGAAQFRKYDTVEVDIRRRTRDSRPESFSPDEQSIEVVDHLKDWKQRQAVFDGVPRTSTCELRRAAKLRHDAPSLGMITVQKLIGTRFEPHPGWTPEEQQKMSAYAESHDAMLFGATPAPPVLRPPRLIMTYHYECTDADCPGHDGRLLDWELTALQSRLVGSDEKRATEIRAKFASTMFDRTRVASFFMGNFENPAKRQNFSVLGVHYPRTEVGTSAALIGPDWEL